MPLVRLRREKKHGKAGIDVCCSGAGMHQEKDALGKAQEAKTELDLLIQRSFSRRKKRQWYIPGLTWSRVGASEGWTPPSGCGHIVRQPRRKPCETLKSLLMAFLSDLSVRIRVDESLKDIRAVSNEGLIDA